MHLVQADLFVTPDEAEVSPDVSPAPASGKIAGLALFDAWRAARLLNGHRKLMGTAGFVQAQFVRRKWLVLCAGREVDWLQALPADVCAFADMLTSRRLGTFLSCSVPCDHMPIRSWPLFKARKLMRGVIESFKQAVAVKEVVA